MNSGLGVLVPVLGLVAVTLGCGEFHDPHEGRDQDEHHEDERLEEPSHVKLTDAEIAEFGIEFRTAGPARLVRQVVLPGEIRLNADRIAHVVPRIPGIVREVHRSVGECVASGAMLVVLDSRELADAKVAWFAACERLTLTEANFKRAEELWRKNISTEKDYLEARKDVAEARIERRAARQKLIALGFSEGDFQTLVEEPDASLTRFEITAPFDGTIIEKHVALGEALKDDSDIFTIADLTTVWVDLSVYAKDLHHVREGQAVLIVLGPDVDPVPATLSYCSPIVREGTRTGTARALLANPEGKLKPGTFVTARVAVGESPVTIAVERTALQEMDGRTVVFVKEDDGFHPTQVQVGRCDRTHAEVTAGVAEGTTYVSKGAFTLKAQMEKSGFGHGHSH